MNRIFENVPISYRMIPGLKNGKLKSDTDVAIYIGKLKKFYMEDDNSRGLINDFVGWCLKHPGYRLTKSKSNNGRIDEIASVVKQYFGVSDEHFLSRCRKRAYVQARYAFFYAASQMTSLSLKAIGEKACPNNPKDHTTVIHGLSAFRDALETDELARKDWKNLVVLLKNGGFCDIQDREPRIIASREQKVIKLAAKYQKRIETKKTLHARNGS